MPAWVCMTIHNLAQLHSSARTDGYTCATVFFSIIIFSLYLPWSLFLLLSLILMYMFLWPDDHQLCPAGWLWAQFDLDLCPAWWQRPFRGSSAGNLDPQRLPQPAHGAWQSCQRVWWRDQLVDTFFCLLCGLVLWMWHRASCRQIGQFPFRLNTLGLS